MTFSLRKAGLAAFAALSIATVPGIAQAATPTVQLNICNASPSKAFQFQVSGHNQHNQFVQTRRLSLSAGGCTLVRNYWWHDGVIQCWQNGQRGGSGGFTTVPPEANGTTQTIRPCGR